jgi:predicted transcriptional regulator
MFGSVHKAIGSSITMDSANAEKERMEGEMEKMMEQMRKLEDLIKNLKQGE